MIGESVYWYKHFAKQMCTINDEDKYISLYSTFTPRNLSQLGILRNGMLWIELCPCKIFMLHP